MLRTNIDLQAIVQTLLFPCILNFHLCLLMCNKTLYLFTAFEATNLAHDFTAGVG